MFSYLYYYFDKVINSLIREVERAVQNLQLKDVTVTIREQVILDQISFSIQPGKITALVGHNGAGKSTIMKVIMGSQEKTSGELFVTHFSQDTDFLSFKQKVSYIPEEPLLLSELTVMQHFQLYGKSYGIKEDELQRLMELYTEKFEIEDKLNEYPDALSKGMRQKVQTICSIIPDVPLLLIDEPFMGLDIYASEYLQQIMVEKASKGTTILLTSHQLQLVKDLADDYVMLQHGRIVDQGRIEDFHELKRRFEE